MTRDKEYNQTKPELVKQRDHTPANKRNGGADASLGTKKPSAKNDSYPVSKRQRRIDDWFPC